MMENFIGTLYLIGFVQSLFISLMILFKRKKQISDYMLSYYILVMGSFLCFMYLNEIGKYPQNRAFIILDILYWVLIGSSLYIYIDLIVSEKQKLRFSHLIHLIPMAIVLFGFSDIFTGPRIKLLSEFQADTIFAKFAVYVWIYNSPVYYLICIFRIRKHKRNIRNYFSNTRNVDLKWLYYLTYGFAFFLFFGLFFGKIQEIIGYKFPFAYKDFNWFGMVIYIFGVGFFGFRQREIYKDLTPVVLADNNLLESVYEKSGLGKEEREMILSQLQNYMKTHKPYFDPELNLRNLSDAIETTPHKLSQVINEQLKCNFFEYVNTFRVEEAKKALTDPNRMNSKIIAIAYDCGFNSKSTFYNVFKKHTSLTPSDYKQKVS